ncbi:MAG: Tat pathway signal sequence domain protein [Alphaproteobacteria bacterium]|nr:MAG: Tat pathway signal sequence domain protein [Alphaproteobacteria bacterium]
MTRSARTLLGWVVAGVATLSMIVAPAAAEPGLHIELNKTEDGGQSCLASFVVRNQLGHTLDRFSLDLYVFDRNGVIIRQVLLDMAPLRNDKTTVARFALIDRPCADIGQLLVNSIPSCRAEESGQTLDCVGRLTVSSRDRIEMVK